MKSKLLVFIQFFLILVMVLQLWNAPSYPFAPFILILLGIFIGISAIQHHKKDNFNIRPDIKENCILVQHGIYKYIRHPMYLSVLTMMLGVFFLYPTLLQFFLYICLLIILLVKLHYEESLWLCHTKEYETYKKRTKKLLPFIF